MDGLSSPLDDVAGAVLDALPVGLAVFDSRRRSVLINAAYCESIGLPPGSYPSGTKLEDLLSEVAYRGLFGPGDPAEQLAAALGADRSRAHRLRRRRFNGRVHDLHNVPLPSGGHIVCSIDVTGVIGERDRAQQVTRGVVSAVATLRTGLAVFAPDGGSGRLVLGNPRFAELLGGTVDGLAPGQTFASLMDIMAGLDEFSSTEGVEYIARHRALDRSAVTLSRRVRPSGDVVETVSSPLPGGGFAITATDITALVSAEDESRRRAMMLEGILDAIPQGVSVFGPDLRARMVNRSYNVIMRKERGAAAPGEAPFLAVGDHLDDVTDRCIASGEYGPADLARIQAERHDRTHAAHLVRRRLRPNGMWIEVSVAGLPDGGHVRVISDVSALIEAEAEVVRRAGHMDSMLANIRHGIALYGADRRLVASNPVAAEVLDQPVDDLMAPGPAAPPDHVHAAPGGRAIEVRSQQAPDGGWVSTFTDVTEAKAAEAELRRAKEAAEAASLAKSRFLATMSHELRTPLHSILGFSDVLLRDAATPDLARVVEYAGAIQQSGRQLLDLINSILDVSRLEAGRLELADDVIDARALIASCVRQAETAASIAGVTVTLPAAGPALALRGDHRRLAQAFGNLLSNAIKFSARGGTVAIGLSADVAGDMLATVEDSGIGIGPDDLGRVFEPFTQVDAGLSRRFPGAGLGLYVARTLVEAHGGRVSLNSRLGEGTCATLTIPHDRVIRPGGAPSREETSS